MDRIFMAVLGGATLLVAVVAMVRSGRREREPEPEPGSGNPFPALERTALPMILAGMGFSRSGHEFSRGGITLKAVFLHVKPGTIDPWPQKLHLHRVGAPGSALDFEADFVGTARAGAPGLSVQSKVESPAEARHAEAQGPSRDRWAGLVKSHQKLLQGLSWTDLEVFHHRTPRMHLYVAPAPQAEVAAQIDAAAEALLLLWAQVQRP